MNPLLILLIALLLTTAAVWIAVYWPVKSADVLSEVMCPLPTEGSAD